MLPGNKIAYLVYQSQIYQPQNFVCDSLQCGCVMVYRSEVVSPTQWAERAEQKARERIQPLLDEAQVGRYSVSAQCQSTFLFNISQRREGNFIFP